MAGADEIVRPEHAAKAVRRHASAVKLTPERGQDLLLGGVDVALECTGSKSALDLALRTTKAGGRVVVLRRSPAPAPTSPRCGSASSSWSAPTRPPASRPFPTVRAARRSTSRSRPRPASRCCPGSSARRTRSTVGARRSTTRCRPARSARSRWRSRPGVEGDRPEMPRPGFVLEVDERTPPLHRARGRGVPDADVPARYPRRLPAGPPAGAQGPARAHPPCPPAAASGDSKPLPSSSPRG